MNDVIQKANVLIEAIPYIHAFRRKVFVIKYGGSLLTRPAVRRNVLQNTIFLNYVGVRIVIVHGGGPFINARMTTEGFVNEFHEGLRVTNKDGLRIVHEELSQLNRQIVQEIEELKGDAVGFTGKEGVIKVRKKEASKNLDFVGSVKSINKKKLQGFFQKNRIVVLSPMGLSHSGQLHNINGDEAASGVSQILKAEKLVLLTNVQGVMREKNNPRSLIPTLTLDEVDSLVQTDVISEGMIPKVKACVEGLKAGVKKTHIVDAGIQHALLLEVFTNKGIGTQIL